MIVSHHGSDAWERIARGDRDGITTFDKMASYPDDLTYRLVGTASDLLGIEGDALIESLGEFWVSYTDTQGYGPLFGIAGDSLRDFLLSLDVLHARVGRSFPDLRPPSFRFDEVDSSTLRMHYLSTRANLCPMIIGLVRGLSRRFKTEVVVSQVACTRRDAAHCEFLIEFPATRK